MIPCQLSRAGKPRPVAALLLFIRKKNKAYFQHSPGEYQPQSSHPSFDLVAEEMTLSANLQTDHLHCSCSVTDLKLEVLEREKTTQVVLAVVSSPWAVQSAGA